MARRPPARGDADTGAPADPPPNGVHGENGTLEETVALAEVDAPGAIELAPGPRLPADPGLYAILGLDPTASDVEIQTTYRRQAAQILSSSGKPALLRQLNVAYEVLGNPYRRAEYDRLRSTQLLAPAPPPPIGSGAKLTRGPTRRRRPRHAVQPRYAGLGDVLVVLTVVGLAVVAGALLIPRLSVNLSALNALQNVLPLTATRRVIDATVTPAPTAAAPTPTLRPGLADRFAGTTINVSNPSPAPNTVENVVVKLRRDGQPAANIPIWSTVRYRTTEERWPASGTLNTDASGTATISFNIGGATPNYAVQVQVYAQADDQQISWSTSFTPH